MSISLGLGFRMCIKGLIIVLWYSGHAMWFGPVLGQHIWQLSRLAWKHKNVKATYLACIGRKQNSMNNKAWVKVRPWIVLLIPVKNSSPGPNNCMTKCGNVGHSDSSSVALRSFCAEKSSKGTLSPSDSTSANDISRAFLKDLYARSSKPKLWRIQAYSAHVKGNCENSEIWGSRAKPFP